MEPSDTTFKMQGNAAANVESIIMHSKNRMKRIAVFILFYVALLVLVLPVTFGTVVPAYIACHFFFTQVLYYFYSRRQPKLVQVKGDELVLVNIANSTRTISGSEIDSIVIAKGREEPFATLTPHLELRDKQNQSLAALPSNYFDIPAIMDVLPAWVAKVTNRPLSRVLDIAPSQIRKTNSTLHMLQIAGCILAILGLVGILYFVNTYNKNSSLTRNGVLVEGTVVGHEVSNGHHYLCYRFTDNLGDIHTRGIWINNALWANYRHNGPIVIKYAAENPELNCFVGEAVEQSDVLLIALSFLVALVGIGLYFIGRIGPTSVD